MTPRSLHYFGQGCFVLGWISAGCLEALHASLWKWLLVAIVEYIIMSAVADRMSK